MTNSHDQTDIAVIKSQLADIKDDVRDIKDKLERDYITRQEFDPYKRIIQGLVALILTAVIGAVMTLIIKK